MVSVVVCTRAALRGDSNDYPQHNFNQKITTSGVLPNDARRLQPDVCRFRLIFHVFDRLDFLWRSV
jgi:hypothetical protein